MSNAVLRVPRSSAIPKVSEHVNRIVDRDLGNTNTAQLTWRANSANYILDADNAGGNHANFGSGIFLIQDGFVTTQTEFVVNSGKKITLFNAGNTNSANLYHSGTNDVLKTDDGLLISTTLNVGGTISAADSGDGFLSGGLSLGTYVNPAAGDLILSHALNVGDSLSATDAGDAWIKGGLSLGTFVNPSAGDLILSHALNVGSSLSATATGEVWISFGLSVGTHVTPALAGDIIGTRIGLGLQPSFPLHVSETVTGDWVAQIEQVDTGATSKGLYIKSGSTNAGAAALFVETGSTARLTVWGDGGVTLAGAANQGAGTLNVTGGIYKNAVAYTNPDAILEHWATGRIAVHAASPSAAGYPGLLSLAEVERYAREHWQLPRVAENREIFERSDILLEKIEELFCYLFEINRRLDAVERCHA